MQIINTIQALTLDSGVARVLVDSAGYFTRRGGHGFNIFFTQDRAGAELVADAGTSHLLPPQSAGRLAKHIAAAAGRGLKVVHDHGQWMSINRASALAARAIGCPRVVSPHGMLTDWAFNHRRLKKRLAWGAYGKRLLLDADAIHVTSELEAAELKNRGVRREAEVIPLGIDTRYPVDAAPRRRDGRRMLYLSRVHRKKGIRELLAAWPQARRPGWELVIAGPDEEDVIAKGGLPDGCRYVGAVDGDAKWELYHSSDVFVLPTHSENFGLVIGEALHAGTPVITTRGAPWPVLRERDCGWWIDIGVEPLVGAMRSAMDMNPDELTRKGEIGRQFITSNLTWDVYVERMTGLYGRCLAERGAAEPPG